MNILFLSLLDFSSFEEESIYTDLLSEFRNDGHCVTAISPTERRKQQKTQIINVDESNKILKLKIGNIQKTNFIEKGISTILLEPIFIHGIRKYLAKHKFDLVIYATPPVTFQKVVSYVKRRDDAQSYLLLKDIFPQNAVDLDKIKKNSLLYRYFRNKEKKLYQVSDYIGTMSNANSNFLKQHNPNVPVKKIEVNPNSIAIPKCEKVNLDKRTKLLNDLGIDATKTIFLFGGNIGIPQGIDFLIEILKKNLNSAIHYLIVGSGTEYAKLERAIQEYDLANVTLLAYMPKKEYEMIEAIIDVGLIFLDKRFTVPNIPSRILGYMKNRKPILAATDLSTDLNEIILEGEFGFWCEHGDITSFFELQGKLTDSRLRKELGENSFKYLEDNFSVRHSYEKIMAHFGMEDNHV